MGGLRIALCHPTWWPEVRRGSERLLADLAAELARRGHAVTLITSHPGPRSSDREHGFEVIRTRRPRRIPPLRHYEDHLASAPGMLAELRRGGFDLVHGFHNGWNYPIVRLAGRLGVKTVATQHGIPIRTWLVERRYRMEMLAEVLAGADATTVLSEAAAERTERYLFVRPDVLPGGVRASAFAEAAGERAPAPTLVSAASLGDPRKRADLLFTAFARVRERLPDARLLVIGTRDPHMSRAAVEPPEGAEWVDGDRLGDLASALGSGWASVLAADGEAFGLVLLESLAAGTPVIAARSDGPGEMLDQGIGWGFPPGDLEALTASIGEALRQPPTGERADRCRQRASEFDWGSIGDLYEDLYQRVIQD